MIHDVKMLFRFNGFKVIKTKKCTYEKHIERYVAGNGQGPEKFARELFKQKNYKMTSRECLGPCPIVN